MGQENRWNLRRTTKDTYRKGGRVRPRPRTSDPTVKVRWRGEGSLPGEGCVYGRCPHSGGSCQDLKPNGSKMTQVQCKVVLQREAVAGGIKRTLLLPAQSKTSGLRQGKGGEVTR